jgi:hypothetical protein
MESQQMIELLLARLDKNAKTSQEQIMAKMDAMHEDMKAQREKLEAMQEDMKADRAQRKRMMVIFGANQEGTKSNSEQMESSPELMQSVGEHQEVTEEAAVMPVGEPRKRRRNRGYCGSRKRVTIADRKVSGRATVARSRRNIFAQE